MILEVTNHSRRAIGSRPMRQWIGRTAVESQLPRLRGGATLRGVYEMPTTRRGRFELSPIELPRADPFGLCSAVKRRGRAEMIAVQPRVVALRRIPTGVSLNLEGPTSDASPQGSITFHRLREYSDGDDIRSVHWPSSARAGRLVVRHNVDTAQPYTVVLLDLDARAYEGESFEEAVDVAASVAMSMSEASAPVQLRATGGDPVGGRGGRDPEAILDRLTDVVPGPPGSLAAELARLRSHRGGSSLVVVTGTIDMGTLPSVRAMCRRFDKVVIVSLDGCPPADSPSTRRHRGRGKARRGSRAALEQRRYQVTARLSGIEVGQRTQIPIIALSALAASSPVAPHSPLSRCRGRHCW